MFNVITPIITPSMEMTVMSEMNASLRLARR